MRDVIRQELRVGGMDMLRAIEAAERDQWSAAKNDIASVKQRLVRILRVMERDWPKLVQQRGCKP
jgi:hypothetical protein